MTTISLCTMSIPNKNGVPKDGVKMQFVLEGSSPLTATQLELAWNSLLNHAGPTNTLAGYLASCLSRVPDAAVAAYDITAVLGGGAMGSPYVTGHQTVGASLGDSRGNQLVAGFGFHSGTYASTPAVGPTAAIPTPESAQDMGAPATHMGPTRPKSRQLARMAFGPLDASAIGVDGNLNPQFTDTFINDAVFILSNWITTIGAITGGQALAVWSRRDAATNTISGGWVDRGVKTRRSKTFLPNLRSTF